VRAWEAAIALAAVAEARSFRAGERWSLGPRVLGSVLRLGEALGQGPVAGEPVRRRPCTQGTV